ncbi:MAG: HEAT repeat domain-containing protein [Phycisphaerales bacterium]|jgi:HEAT repeat protein|nr:HEAT repeat domain-containing protein [Phycisphaerales bacterium]
MNRISGKVIFGIVVIVILLVLITIQFVGDDTPDLAEGDVAQRITAINTIASSEGVDTGEKIAHVGVNDSNPRVRCAAMVSLRKFAFPEIRNAIEQGTKDQSSRVRAAAAVTLGKFNDKKAVNRLDELLQADKDEEVRLAAALALARCKSRESAKKLVSSMKTNSSQVVQKQSMLLLLQGTGVSLRPEPDPRDKKLWARHMKQVMRYVDTTWGDESPEVRK